MGDQSNNTVLALQHLAHARTHLVRIDQALRDGVLIDAIQNAKDARTDLHYVLKHTQMELARVMGVT